jgi:hypothetical protein
MTKAWLTYFLLRVGIFLLALILFAWLGVDPLLAAVFAAVVGLAISLLFLGKQRNQISTAIYENGKKPKVEAEDAILDKDGK